jgi:hypothetical protein
MSRALTTVAGGREPAPGSRRTRLGPSSSIVGLPEDALTLSTATATATGAADPSAQTVDLSGIWALSTERAPLRSHVLIRALDSKGRLQLPITPRQAERLPAQRESAVITVFLPGSPTGPRPGFTTVAQQLDARGRLTLTAGLRREAGIGDGADLLAHHDPKAQTVTLVAAGHLDDPSAPRWTRCAAPPPTRPPRSTAPRKRHRPRTSRCGDCTSSADRHRPATPHTRTRHHELPGAAVSTTFSSPADDDTRAAMRAVGAGGQGAATGSPEYVMRSSPHRTILVEDVGTIRAVQPAASGHPRRRAPAPARRQSPCSEGGVPGPSPDHLEQPNRQILRAQDAGSDALTGR